MTDTLPEHPPQTPIPMSETRIWIDGCFDFTHHGHAGAMLQAKRLLPPPTYLCVGIHTDEAIASNKGPPVMSLRERVLAVSACRWANLPVPGAPYVTEPEWMDSYGCRYVVHGDDVTTDADGQDCYRIVKQAGRFKVVKRTPGISTTDLVGRMLLCSRAHHISDLPALVREDEELLGRMRAYASDEFGREGRGPPVHVYVEAEGKLEALIAGVEKPHGKRLVYVDGGFDLFTPGHIAFLQQIRENDPDAYVLAGIHSDRTVNVHKGLNYPIMNAYERTLCVLQCRYIDALVIDAPFSPDARFLDALGKVEEVWHGPTRLEESEETYMEARRRGVYREGKEHEWVEVNARHIVDRILRQREVYEERQRKKGVKAEREDQMVN